MDRKLLNAVMNKEINKIKLLVKLGANKELLETWRYSNTKYDILSLAESLKDQSNDKEYIEIYRIITKS